MNLSQYIVAALVVQTVRCNTIGGKLLLSRSSKNPDLEIRNTGVKTIGDNRDFATKENAITNDLTKHPINYNMTSSDLYHLILTSQTSIMKPQVRIRRGTSPNKGRKKIKCDPTDTVCKKNRRKKGNKKGKKACKKRGKNGKLRKCSPRRRKVKTPKPPRRRKTPKPNKGNSTYITEIDIPTDFNKAEECIRSSDCPAGWCCARQQWHKVCKPMLKVTDICPRPTPKHRKRSSDFYELCPCEHNLTCRRDKSSNDGRTKSRLFTCQQNT